MMPPLCPGGPGGQAGFLQLVLEVVVPLVAGKRGPTLMGLAAKVRDFDGLEKR